MFVESELESFGREPRYLLLKESPRKPSSDQGSKDMNVQKAWFLWFPA